MKDAIINFFIRFFAWGYNFSYHKLSALAMLVNHGIHPKHDIVKYDRFFINHIEKNDTVLDVGCGDGWVTQEIAKKARHVTGIDKNEMLINYAKKQHGAKNITYIFGDVLAHSFKAGFDKVILSNVLEHIKNRQNFLLRLHDLTNTLLIRVPLLTRDWLPVYLKQHGFDYRVDPSHFLEYTEDGFRQELQSAHWQIKNISIQFGELWAIANK